MSDSVKPPLHGRDHRPGGSDPIPGQGGIPWVRLRQLSLAQDLTGGNVVILFDSTTNHYPDYFAVSNYPATSNPALIQPKLPGLYQVTVRLDFNFLSFPFQNPIELAINAVDWDVDVAQYSYYSTPIMGWNASVSSGTWPAKTPFNTSGFAYGEVTFRANLNDSSGAAMKIYALVNTPGGALSETIKLYGGGASGGTYMEMRYLGADPYGAANT